MISVDESKYQKAAPKRIAVTGGSGRAGQAVIKDLLAHGYDVTNLDTVTPPEAICPFRQVDMTDYGNTFAALHGFDTVVHLAGDPRPDYDPFAGAQRFHNNTACVYNVFNAATAMGMQRVVWASSETIHGFPFDVVHPDYIPIDEQHPPYPQSSYALSKWLTEEMARQFNRRFGMPIIGLRFSNILYPAVYENCPQFWADPTIRSFDLWSYVDYQDVTQSIRLSLTADIQGAEAFIIAAADTIMNRPTRELMQEFFPEVPVPDDFGEFQSTLSTQKAHDMLGYTPQVSWRNYISGD